MGREDIFSEVNLGDRDLGLLKKIAGDLPILSDLCRADLLLFCQDGAQQAIVVAQEQPHSSSPLYEESCVGLRVDVESHARVLRGLKGRTSSRPVYTVEVKGATVARQIFPIRNAQGDLIAVMTKDAYWLAYERHRRRSRVFQDALLDFVAMVLRGKLVGGDSLAPFGEHDGIVFVGADRHIKYMSGIASELYRQLGYRDSLIGRHISEIETIGSKLVIEAVNEQKCIELQTEQDGFTWIRKALPITVPACSFSLKTPFGKLKSEKIDSFQQGGVFILCYDATESLEAQREIESKMAMVREVHHRVKNNLQVIASIMRMQARRVVGQEAKSALEESVNRILSVAVVHDFLSHNAEGLINLRDVTRRIVEQTKQGLIDPEKAVKFSIRGPDIWLPAERATQCALVINELVQNAIEHGMAHSDEGSVEVELVDHGEEVTLVVADDGQGLPTDFDLERDSNLGLRIVRSMVERDLAGELKLTSTFGTRATIRFAKSI